MTANLVRWDPFAELVQFRNTMDRLLGDFQPVRPAFNGSTEIGYVPFDVTESEDGYDVIANLPGIQPEDVNIQIHGETVTITGEIKDEVGTSQNNWLLRERRYGKFSRSLTLPTTLDADKAAADFKHGVLKLHLPKSEASKPKTIKVAVAE